MAVRPPIPFLTDEDVPDSVGRVLEERGHVVRRVRDEMVTGSADAVVAAAARESGFVLVTHNYRDFRRIAREHLHSTNAKVDRLCRVELECGQPQAASRVRDEIDLIEREFLRRDPESKAGIRISITRTGFRVVR
ncbi:DUF5615 family PIN-like protein [Tsuneonella sp. SYSU-LHT278]|uniref:DUF5615 family PIN-like protein n=1 Tax=Tsuneonella sediminis TaxID=3416089 RepID=UPI003F7AA55B